MRLQDWEATIREIVDECGHEQKGMDGIFTAWRTKLKKGPTLLQPQQIDEIIREARRRLTNLGR